METTLISTQTNGNTIYYHQEHTQTQNTMNKNNGDAYGCDKISSSPKCGFDIRKSCWICSGILDLCANILSHLDRIDIG